MGDRHDEDTKNLVKVVHKVFLPNKVLIVTDEDPNGFIRGKVKSVAALKKIDGAATAYVCENFTCSLPVNSPGALEKLLSSSPDQPTSSS